MPDTRKLPTLCLDFDGVVHSYDKGWMDGSIYGTTTEGFWPWVIEASRRFSIVIHSSRFSSDDGMREAAMWMPREFMKWAQRQTTHPGVDSYQQLGISLSRTKPAAILTIDDRALTFTGSWDDFPMERLRDFKTWQQMPPPEPATGPVEESEES